MSDVKKIGSAGIPLNIVDANGRKIMGDAYDNTAIYAVGDYCISGDHAYKCTTEIETPEDFNTNHWQQITIEEILKEHDASIESVNSSLTHNLMSYEDITVTTGTTQYVGYYYGDGSITTSVADKEIVSAFVYSATSNRPAFLQRIGATSIRAFCPVSDTTVVIRVLFKHN